MAVGEVLGASKTVLGALGLGGESPEEKGLRHVADLRTRISRGDVVAVAGDPPGTGGMYAKTKSRYNKVSLRAIESMNQYARGVNSRSGEVYQPAVVATARKFWMGGQPWVGSTGTVPSAMPGSMPGGMMPPSGAGAQPAGSAPAYLKPCKWGPRDPVTGFCPKKGQVAAGGAAAQPSYAAQRPCAYGPRDPVTGFCPRKGAGGGGAGARPQRPCAYGPRDPVTGLCPPKGRTGRARKTAGERATDAALRRAQTAGGNVAVKGARGAAQAAAAAGVTPAMAVGVAAALIAAAALGWMIGQDVNRALSGEGKQNRLTQAALDRQHAVTAMREQLGRQPTLAEQQPITNAYNDRVKRINSGGF